MSKNISRRTFLKCAGAVTVAAGAASMLGGCSLLDDLIEKISDESGIAMKTIGENGAVWISAASSSIWWGSELIGVNFQVKNKQDKELTFKSTDITNVKIDGHKAAVVLAPDENRYNYNKDGKHPLLFDKTTGTKVYPANNDYTTAAVDGFIFFSPEYDEGEEHLTTTWRKLEFTVKLNGGTATVIVTRSGDKDVTSAIQK